MATELEDLRKMLAILANRNESIEKRDSTRITLQRALTEPGMRKAWDETVGNTLSKDFKEDLASFNEFLQRPALQPRPSATPPTPTKSQVPLHHMNELFPKVKVENPTEFSRLTQKSLCDLMKRNPQLAVKFLNEKAKENANWGKVGALLSTMKLGAQHDSEMKQALNDMLMGLKANTAGATMLGSTGQVLGGDQQTLTGEIGKKVNDQSAFKMDHENDKKINNLFNSNKINDVLESAFSTVDNRLKQISTPKISRED